MAGQALSLPQTTIGKKAIKLFKEVPGHVANRMQAAIWREAIHLAQEGVASLADVDAAIAYGPASAGR